MYTDFSTEGLVDDDVYLDEDCLVDETYEIPVENISALPIRDWFMCTDCEQPLVGGIQNRGTCGCPRDKHWAHLKDQAISRSIRHDALPHLSVQSARESEWWHGTDSEVWPGTAHKPFVGQGFYAHLGTLAAALDRAEFCWVGDTLQEAKFNRTRVVHAATWSPDIHEDGVYTECPPPSSPFSVYRYLNRYESPGSISIVAHTDMLIVTEVLTYAEARYMQDCAVECDSLLVTN